MAIVQLRVNDDLKAKASSIYEKLGIDLSSDKNVLKKVCDR